MRSSVRQIHRDTRLQISWQKAFITPIEREDIIALSHHIDDVTDKIEEVLIRVYINNVQEMCQEVFLMLDVVIECCEELQTLLKEFKNFKHSKELKPSIIRMNTLEEKEDELFISSMRKLHVEEQDVRNIIAWREIYTYLEKCADACEHVADIVGSVAIEKQTKKEIETGERYYDERTQRGKFAFVHISSSNASGDAHRPWSCPSG